ncbi:MAG: 3-hydroxyacyl-ACP dehydratase FabZ family protein [Pirellulales bacterium]
MRYTLIDRIVRIEPGSKIVAVKALSLAEEYLDDHFPLFPVMPGVLMLEAMTQTAAWLVRASEDFAHSMVVLKEARNVKYADFVEPGQSLEVTCEITAQDDRETKVKAAGTVNGRTAVSARLVLERYNQGEQEPHRAALDGYTKRELRELFQVLYPAAAAN